MFTKQATLNLSDLQCFLCAEKEKVEGEELQEWLKMVVTPAELTFFISGKQESLLPLQTGPGQRLFDVK